MSLNVRSLISALQFARKTDGMFGLLLLMITCSFTNLPGVRGNKNMDADKYFTPENVGGPDVKRIYISTPEEISPGSLLLDLTKHQTLKTFNHWRTDGKLTTVGGGSVHYRLLNVFDAGLFRIGSASGRITVATRLDREALCASQKAQFCCNARVKIPKNLQVAAGLPEDPDLPVSHVCHLVLHISVQTEADQSHVTTNRKTHESGDATVGQSKLALIYLYIRLDDINDHTPQFESFANNLNIAEDTPIGSLLHYFRVSDPDGGSNALKDVRIEVKPLPVSEGAVQNRIHSDQILQANNQPFEVRLNRDGVSLVLVQGLDREAIPAYDIALTAIDGNPIRQLSSRINLRVHVTDVNDNPPVWVVHRQRQPGAPGAVNGMESEARLLGHLTSDALAALPTYFNISMSEDTQVGSLVYWLKAIDADFGDNGRLQYAIDTTAPGGMSSLEYFTVQPTTGEVRLRTQLDYEVTSVRLSGPIMEIPVVVRDSPRVGRQLSTSAVIRVTITDINDMSPIITASPLIPQPFPVFSGLEVTSGRLSQTKPSFYIWENQSPGQPVASILVSDPDTGEGGRVTCSVKNDYFRLVVESGGNEDVDSTLIFPHLNGASSGKSEFQIPELLSSPTTYQLISTQQLDRESNSLHSVILTCRDHDPLHPLFSTQQLDIEVLDENDNAPVFSSPIVNFSVAENQPPGQLVGYLNATDRDIGGNAQLRYWVDEADGSWVGMHSQTGEIRINAIFDRETEAERQFTAYVVDSRGSDAHTASTQVTVLVLDENDHTPRFTDLYFFSVPENSPPGTVVGTIKAVDEDDGENGKVRYLLRQPSREFELNPDTGRLTVRRPHVDPMASSFGRDFVGVNSLLDREEQERYELTVNAEDGGVPPRRTSTVVHISISDVNDHAPEFRYPSPHGIGSVLNMSCIQLGNQIIAKVHANDSDADRNGEIEYSILRSTKIWYNSKKALEDSGANESKTGNNTGAPEKDHQKQNTTVTDQVAQATGKNPVSVKSNISTSQHTRQLIPTGGPTPEHFDIDSYSGQLFLIHRIMDCSKPSDVRLLILASDGGDPPRSSTATLNIHIHPTYQKGASAFGSFGLSDTSEDQRASQAVPPSQGQRSAGLGFHMSTWRRDEHPTGDGRRDVKNSQILASGGHLLSSTSHWSAIIGLVVAMVILVILLCVMLIVLRRRFGFDDRKNGRKGRGNNDNNRTSPLKSDDEIHHQSPMALSPVPNSPPTIGTRYFCTLPPQGTSSPGTKASGVLGTTVTLNSGEIALLQHNNTIGTLPAQSTRSSSSRVTSEQQSPHQVIYRTSNGDLYGYIPTANNNRSTARRGQQQSYQTLQAMRHQNLSTNSPHQLLLVSSSKEVDNSFGLAADAENNSNNSPEGIGFYQGGHGDSGHRWAPASSSQYTPLLLETTFEDHQNCQLATVAKQHRSPPDSPQQPAAAHKIGFPPCADSSGAAGQAPGKSNDILSADQLHGPDKSGCSQPCLGNRPETTCMEAQPKGVSTSRYPNWNTARSTVVESNNLQSIDSTASFV